MDYRELKYKILYSKAMRDLHSKKSPVRKYLDMGAYARDVQRYTDTVALCNCNDLNPHYCSVLAFADALGIPPYLEEEKLALKELLGDAYDKVEVSVAKLQEIAGEQIPEQLKKDLRDLESQNETMSNEAKIVQIVKKTLEVISLMTKEEYEKMGGPSLAVSILEGVKQDENGRVQSGAFLNKLIMTVNERKGTREEK